MRSLLEFLNDPAPGAWEVQFRVEVPPNTVPSMECASCSVRWSRSPVCFVCEKPGRVRVRKAEEEWSH